MNYYTLVTVFWITTFGLFVNHTGMVSCMSADEKDSFKNLPNICFGAVFVILLTTAKSETNSSACEHKEKNLALLDLAKVSIDKVKDIYPDCDNDSRNVTSNSTECGAKEKVSAYVEIAKNLIDQARRNYSTCDVTDKVKDNVTEIVVFRNPRPADCSEVLENGDFPSGIYKIWPRNRFMKGRSIPVYCDMDTDGGGWTVIQRREDSQNKTDFYKEWFYYKHGFGNVGGEYWLGNDNIFSLTNQRDYSLRFDMKNVSGDSRYAIYSSFWIEDGSVDYRMHIGNYNGTAGDGIRESDNMKFSTKDKRNDLAKHVCAEQKKAGWWFKDCSRSNPNGINKPGGYDDHELMNWFPWTNYDSLLSMEMKIR